MTEEIESLAQRLVAAIETTMNPNSTQVQRAEAYTLYENFKETSPLCAQCGLFLSKKENPSVVRHFGYQLIEHCIKFRWNLMSPEEKLYIKNNTMELLSLGTLSILEEEFHIKDALSRIVVEMIKREWPQQWSTLLKELFTLCEMGETQKELVLLIFLRLAEDVFVLQNIPGQRRREIYSGLTQNITEIWGFFLKTLSKHYGTYKGSQNEAQQMIHSRIVNTLLETMCGGFLEWIPSHHLMSENCILLQMLCQLLVDEQSQLLAAECLLIIVGRKGKIEERKPVLLLFSNDPMVAIFEAAKLAANSDPTKKYSFLKRICAVVAGLGAQLTGILASGRDDESIPSTFGMFLEIAMSFTKHPSHLVTSIIIPTWSSFFANPVISKHEVLLAAMPKLLDVTVEKFLKIGFPTRIDSPSCCFSRLDFDNDDDFSLFFFGRFRVDLSDMIRNVTLLDPSLTFNNGAKWLYMLISQPIITDNDSKDGMCDSHSPSAIQWEGLATYLECSQVKLLDPSQPQLFVEDGTKLLKTLLEFKTEDPILVSSILSCISALFHFVVNDQQYFIVVLEKIFSAVVFGNTVRQDNSIHGKLVKNVRRHACSSLIKIGKTNPVLLVSMFDQVYGHIKRLAGDNTQISHFEKGMLYEFLVIISNEFNDYNRQVLFFQEIMAPIQSMWLAPDFLKALGSVQSFATNLGLLKSGAIGNEDPYCMYRIHVVHRISFVIGVLKRSKWPSDPDVARRGGYVLNEDGGVMTFRNPVTPSIAVLLKWVFQLIRVLNSLWLPEVRQNFHPDFADALGVREAERQCILGPGSVPPVSQIKPPCDKMQQFIAVCYEHSLNIVGNAGPILGAEFYAIPELSNIIFESLFTGLEHISDFKLKLIIRTFFKPYIQHCPPQYEDSAVLPVLTALCPFMFQKLSIKWEVFSQRYGTSTGSEDLTEAQEIFEDQLNRMLTKEYLDLLVSLLFSKSNSGSNNDGMEEDSERPPSSGTDQISPRGIKLLSSEKICSAVVMTIFGALHWLDTTASVKANNMAFPVLKQIVSDNLLTKEEEAQFILQSILQGLFNLGEHDINCSLLVALGTHTCELLRPRFPTLLDSLRNHIPDTQEKDLKSFDEKIDPNSAKKCGDKVKKAAFRKIVEPIIGRNIGQMHKRKIEILNLQPISKYLDRRRFNVTMSTDDEETGICDLFK